MDSFPEGIRSSDKDISLSVSPMEQLLESQDVPEISIAGKE